MTAERMKNPPKEESSEKRDSVFADMFAVIMVSYAFVSFGYEKYMPKPFMNMWNGMMFIMFAVVWLFFSFRNGREKRILFPIFTAVFFMLPEILIFLANDGPGVFRMSIPMYVLSEFSMLFANGPLTFLTEDPEEHSHFISSLICMLCSLAACGIGYASTLKKKGNYTPKRWQL